MARLALVLTASLVLPAVIFDLHVMHVYFCLVGVCYSKNVRGE